MSIILKKKVAVLENHCSIEEAETLLGWFIENPSGKINVKNLEHMHTAVLQVLMAKQPSVTSWPTNDIQFSLLKQILN